MPLFLQSAQAELQVRTRPTFSVVTSPACSRTPTCFFMPVRVMWNFSARSVIEGPPRGARENGGTGCAEVG